MVAFRAGMLRSIIRWNCCALVLMGFALTSVGCWVRAEGGEPRHGEHHEHERRSPPGHDDHHDDHHEDHHDNGHHGDHDDHDDRD